MKKSELNVKINKVNFLKNFFQYFIGASLFFITFNDLPIVSFVLGLMGFLISYQSVYQFNDLMDYEEDKKNYIKKDYKPLVTGSITRKEMETYTFLLVMVGLPICFLVSTFYGFLVTITLMLNFLYSSKYIRLKKTRFWGVTIFFIQFLKHSTGWFALAITMEKFPIIFIMSLSLLYVLAFMFYKKFRIKISDWKTVLVTILTAASLVISFFIYPFKLPLLLFIPFSFIFLVLKSDNAKKNLVLGSRLAYISYAYFIITILLLSIPAIAEINEEIAEMIDIVNENIESLFPSDVVSEIKDVGTEIDKIDIDVFNET